MSALATHARRGALLLCTWLALVCPLRGMADEPFAAHALRGMQQINVAVDGVDANFARYGLRADEVRKHLEVKLAAAGLGIADDAEAQSDAAVSQLRLKLNVVENVYAFYSYALNLQARRKLPLGNAGGFVSQSVWSAGQTGVINPTDMPRLYAVIDQLLAHFLSAHGTDNVAAGATAAP